MESLVKLESINCWAGSLGIMQCDDNGMPILEKIRVWDSIDKDWFQNLTMEEKELVNKIKNNGH